MTFSSYSFLCVFLPLTLLGFYRCQRPIVAKIWMLLASLLFYSSLEWRHLPLLLGCMGATYAIHSGIRRTEGAVKTFWLVVGLCLNAGVLGICKYVPGATQPFPVGISFYTIQHMAFLVDVYQGLVTSISFMDFALFVAWFPRIVSGPILDTRETLQEFAQPELGRVNARSLALGLMIFFMGLAKKVLVADVLASWVAEGFSRAASLRLFEAWVTALSFTFQIYFDFSGYSDMAVGLARLFNVRLPNNFDSPYRATSIIEFWSRWHITLTRFITSYLYTPLVRVWAPVTFNKTLLVTLVTMTLVGLWHGPAWTYVVFGAIHGVAMVVNHLVRRWKWPVPGPLGWGMTFLVVIVAFVFFRAADVSQAMQLLEGMSGARGLLLSKRFAGYVALVFPKLPVFVGSWHIAHMGFAVLWLPILLLVSCLPHNSRREEEIFEPTLLRAVTLAVLIFLGFLQLNQHVAFVYARY